MPQLLLVPYHPQITDGYCLAACAQMVLHYWGINRDQEQIASQLGIIPHVGVPASRIKRLASAGINVVYDIGEWDTLVGWLDKKVPLLAAIQAGELTHW